MTHKYSNEMLSMLCCPETHQKLVPLEPVEVALLNDAIKKGHAFLANGVAARELVDGAFAREDRAFIYPVRQSFLNMLSSDRLVFPSSDKDSFQEE